jgi:short-subunit dehydrogenase
VIVTGASSGIGKAAVISLVNSGYQVFGLARNLANLESIEAGIRISAASELEKRFIPIEFDITKHACLDEVLNRVVKKSFHNKVYGLVNNAGYLEPGSIEDITIESLRSQFETNFFGLVNITKKVISIMTNNIDNSNNVISEGGGGGGRIVNVSSLAGLVSLPLIGAYSCTKFALEAFSDALRPELWKRNIKVVTINPGVVDTNIHSVYSQKLDQFIKNGSRFSKAYIKYLKGKPKGMPSSKVAKVIVKAISLPNPRNRYVVSSTRESLGLKIFKAGLIPDRVLYSEISKRLEW